ncbi:COMM domain-containing protein 8-like [Dendronephthya gigantea]|uniref:COMM domain-containing protein 8-like n=1 Tax=Dendronephthya gigantea TaxID=151771 RepID=UPI00106D444E|nr:COMM domain-containing protein 8-like [Dendronephthya gigantea]
MASGRSEDLNKEIKLIEKCPKDSIPKVIHGFLDEICGQNILRFQDFTKIWSIEEWKQLKASWTSCLRSLAKDNITVENIEKQLDQISISKDIQKVVSECLKPRKEEIRVALIEETCNLSQATLKDFDWKLKLIMATDKLSNMREPVVSLDLDIKEKAGMKHVLVELSKDELKELIASLEAANKVVMQLKL